MTNGPESRGGWPSRELSWWHSRRPTARSAMSNGQMFGPRWSTRCGMGTTSWSIASRAATEELTLACWAELCWQARASRRPTATQLHREPSWDRAAQSHQGPRHEEVAEQSLPGHGYGGPSILSRRAICSHRAIQHSCVGRGWYHFVPA